jgi:phosphatidylserine synthase
MLFPDIFASNHLRFSKCNCEKEQQEIFVGLPVSMTLYIKAFFAGK